MKTLLWLLAVLQFVLSKELTISEVTHLSGDDSVEDDKKNLQYTLNPAEFTIERKRIQKEVDKKVPKFHSWGGKRYTRPLFNELNAGEENSLNGKDGTTFDDILLTPSDYRLQDPEYINEEDSCLDNLDVINSKIKCIRKNKIVNPIFSKSTESSNLNWKSYTPSESSTSYIEIPYDNDYQDMIIHNKIKRKSYQSNKDPAKKLNYRLYKDLAWNGKRIPAFSSWGGKRSPSLYNVENGNKNEVTDMNFLNTIKENINENSEDMEAKSFDLEFNEIINQPTNGAWIPNGEESLANIGIEHSSNQIEKRTVDSKWAGKRPAFSSWGGKRDAAFSSWGGKRYAAFSRWIPNGEESLANIGIEDSSNQIEKRTVDSKWARKRPAFFSWGGKRDAAFSSWGGKRDVAFSSWGGKKRLGIHSWCNLDRENHAEEQLKDYSLDVYERGDVLNKWSDTQMSEPLNWKNDYIFSNSSQTPSNYYILKNMDNYEDEGNTPVWGKKYEKRTNRIFAYDQMKSKIKRSPSFNSWGDKMTLDKFHNLENKSDILYKQIDVFHKNVKNIQNIDKDENSLKTDSETLRLTDGPTEYDLLLTSDSMLNRRQPINSWRDKRMAQFNSWGGKRTPTFKSLDDKRAFSSWGGKKAAAFNSWGGKRATAFNSWGGKRVPSFDSLKDKRGAAFSSWGGKRTTAYNSWEGKRTAAFNSLGDKRVPTFDNLEDKRGAAFNSWGGKRAAAFNSWGGNKNQTFDNLEDKRATAFNSWGEKRTAAFNSWEDKRVPTFNSLEDKRAAAFNSWGGKRAPAFNSWGSKRAAAFNSWGGKRVPTFDSLEDKRTPAFNSWGGKRAAAFSSWGGKRVPTFDSLEDKRAAPFNSWGGKRATAFNSWGGKRVPTFDSLEDKRTPAFNSWGGKRAAAFNSWGGKRVPTFDSLEDKRAAPFNSWGGKRATAFNSWGGKRVPTFDSLEDKRTPAFNSWGGKRAAAFNSWGGKRVPTFDRLEDKRAAPFNSWGGKRATAFNSWGGKRVPTYDSLEDKRGAPFNSWGGKRAASFSSWGGKRVPTFDSLEDKRAAAFNSWGGKRAAAFNSWGGKRVPTFDSLEDKRAAAFNSWGGKRAAAFNSWGGKRVPTFDSLEDKRAAVFNSWGGKRAAAFNSWGGKRVPTFDSLEDKRAAAFNSWGGKRAAAAFNSWGGKRVPTFDSLEDKRAAPFNSWGGKRAPVFNNWEGETSISDKSKRTKNLTYKNQMYEKNGSKFSNNPNKDWRNTGQNYYTKQEAQPFESFVEEVIKLNFNNGTYEKSDNNNKIENSNYVDDAYDNDVDDDDNGEGGEINGDNNMNLMKLQRFNVNSQDNTYKSLDERKENNLYYPINAEIFFEKTLASKNGGGKRVPAFSSWGGKRSFDISNGKVKRPEVIGETMYSSLYDENEPYNDQNYEIQNKRTFNHDPENSLPYLFHQIANLMYYLNRERFSELIGDNKSKAMSIQNNIPRDTFTKQINKINKTSKIQRKNDLSQDKRVPAFYSWGGKRTSQYYGHEALDDNYKEYAPDIENANIGHTSKLTRNRAKRSVKHYYNLKNEDKLNFLTQNPNLISMSSTQDDTNNSNIEHSPVSYQLQLLNNNKNNLYLNNLEKPTLQLPEIKWMEQNLNKDKYRFITNAHNIINKKKLSKLIENKKSMEKKTTNSVPSLENIGLLLNSFLLRNTYFLNQPELKPKSIRSDETLPTDHLPLSNRNSDLTLNNQMLPIHKKGETKRPIFWSWAGKRNFNKLEDIKTINNKDNIQRIYKRDIVNTKSNLKPIDKQGLVILNYLFTPRIGKVGTQMETHQKIGDNCDNIYYKIMNEIASSNRMERTQRDSINNGGYQQMLFQGNGFKEIRWPVIRPIRRGAEFYSWGGKRHVPL